LETISVVYFPSLAALSLDPDLEYDFHLVVNITVGAGRLSAQKGEVETVPQYHSTRAASGTVSVSFSLAT
jgi:hypothetical protein